jgi:PII-like signaling protein
MIADDPATAPRAVAVRIYCTADDRLGHTPLVSAVTAALHDHGAAEVVVLRASRGFGRPRHLHDIDAVDSGMNHPAVIEWVDSEDGFRRIWSAIRPLVSRELVTLEPVTLAAAPPRSRPPAARPAPG